MRRLKAIDGLRGIAAFLVLIYHYFYRFYEIYPEYGAPLKIAHFGSYGVELFFIISGFVIYFSINSNDSFAKFAFARFFRLYPNFWICALITYTFINMFGLPEREIGFKDAILNIFMFHNLIGIPHIDGVYWTLQIELIFYFWVSLFLFFKKLRYLNYFLFASILWPIFMKAFFNINFSLIHIVLASKYMPYFLLGICLYQLIMSKKLLPILAMLLFLISAIWFLQGYIEAFIAVSLALIFYLTARGSFKFLENKYLVSLGGISYTLYLIHQNVGYILIREISVYQNNFITNLLVAVIILLLAIFLDKFIIINFTKKIKKIASYLFNNV